VGSPLNESVPQGVGGAPQNKSAPQNALRKNIKGGNPPGSFLIKGGGPFKKEEALIFFGPHL